MQSVVASSEVGNGDMWQDGSWSLFACPGTVLAGADQSSVNAEYWACSLYAKHSVYIVVELRIWIFRRS